MLSLDNLSKSYGGRKILDGVSWSMNDDGRVGLVGLNGAGKSTLLKMIAEVLPLDSGRITRPQRTRVGYLAQDAPEMGGRSVLRETLAALDRMQALDLRRIEVEQILAHEHSGPAHDAALEELGEVLTELERHDFYSAESRATSVLFGLGFTEEDLGRDVAEFSGGIRMRIALAKLLLDAPEFMMLDEPTNHLDIEARNWLEDYLCAYQGGIILVSHDRYFLDRVTTRTVEVSRGRLTEYVGGYSRYLVAREERFTLEMAAFERQREEIEHMESFISRFRYQASKARLVQSRIKQLEKLERLEPPEGSQKPPAISFPKCERSTRRVFELKGAVKRYGALTVYDGVDLTIERGARIALVGPNGSGKSTMMKLLAGVEPMSGGERIVGPSVQSGYFAQNLAESLSYDKTVLDELSDNAPGRTTAEIRIDSRRDAVLGRRRVQARRGPVGRRARAPRAGQGAGAAEQLPAARRADQQPRHRRQGHAARSAPALPRHRHYSQSRSLHPQRAGDRGARSRPGARDSLPRQLRRISRKEGADRSAVAVVAANALRARASARHARQQRRRAAFEKGRARRRPRIRRTTIVKKFASVNATRASGARSKPRSSRRKTNARRSRTEMNDPNFYLARKDADDLIARYERLGREIEKLYADLVKFDEPASA